MRTLRTVQLGSHRGWIHVRHAPEKRALLVELTHALTPVLPALLGRLRHLFDLSARPDVIAAHLMQDRLLAGAVARNPGLRVPGAFDGFELAVRAILGQQITVKAATTLAGRFAAAFGEPIETPHPRARLACARRRSGSPPRQVEELAALGIIRTRARSILALAQEVASGRLTLEAGAHPPPYDQAACRPAGHRRVDSALYRHAGAALAGRLPEGGHRLAEPPRRRDRDAGGRTVAGVAALAQLRDAASLAEPDPDKIAAPA